MRRASRLLVCAAAWATGCLPFSGPGHRPWVPPGAPAARAPVLPREPCADRDPRRSAYFGDLHVHTALSLDAYGRGLRSGPDDAYRFARGEPLEQLLHGPDGSRRRTLRIERPLDFAAVTDHAEWLGEVSLCTRPGSAVYDSRSCRVFRRETPSRIPVLGRRYGPLLALIDGSGRKRALCGGDATRCRAELASAWQATRAAAERWYDRSAACRFTTFLGWEYTAAPGSSMTHRNVILRNEIAPELPISWIDEPEPAGLLRQLREKCNRSGSGCEALAIPHNPNLSNGRMFTIPWRGLPEDEQRARAALRAALEPLVEMMQAKGESECRDGLFGVAGAPDELCGFEKLGEARAPLEDCREGTGAGALRGRGCVSRLDYVRYALVEGLREGARIGVNPYRFGLIGSSDGHSGAPGDTEEFSYDGVNAAGDDTPLARLDPASGYAPNLFRNPGGLVGIWAEENSRDALFDAMLRRETFATSGTRLRTRLFAGFELDPDACGRADPIGYADGAGVPMGSELPPAPDASRGPAFLVTALRDPGSAAHPGTRLERIQIVKGQVGDDGRFHQAVYDVAGSRRGASVDPATCEPVGPGSDALCGVWRDPAFDPRRPAVYYARVLENPTCRWSWRQCLALPEAQRPAGCSDARVSRTVQERAWTSPVWFTPG